MSVLSQVREFLARTFEDARTHSLVIGFILLLSFVLPVKGIPVGICVYKALTGVECPACGLTRAFVALSHGRWVAATQANRAGVLVYAFFWLLLVNRMGAAAGKRVLPIAEHGGVYVFLWAALLAQWMARHL